MNEVEIEIGEALEAGRIYASCTVGSYSGGSIRLQPSEKYPFGLVVGAARDAETLLARFPQLVIVRDGVLSTGGGITIMRDSESYWLPFRLVQGHPGAEEKQLESIPYWVHRAYEWRESLS